MKLLVLYRPNSEHSLAIEKYCEELKKDIYGINLEIIDVDSTEGAEKMSAYGIMSFPAFIVTRDDGQVQNIWQSEYSPTKDELEAYLVS
jgi:protein-disulfide isomerase-like protein with CxxC motif